MVDYTIANQIRPFQLPDIAGIAGAMQGLELNRMRSQQLQGAEQERNALRQLMATPGFDPSAPDAARRLLEVAPTTGAATYQALMAGQREQRQAQTAQTEAALKNFDLSRERLRGIATLPENDRQAAWDAWRAQTETSVPGTRGFIPPTYSNEAFASMIAKADEIAKNLTERPTALAGPGGIPVFADRRTGTFRMGTEVPGAGVGAPAPAAAPPGPRAEGPAMTPGQTAARSQSTDPLLIDAVIRRNEGTARNPASSAVGPYQFIDSTFVDQFRRSFPDVARTLSREQILTFRGSRTPDGRSVEEVMGPALTAQNQQALTQAGIAPTAGNTYLAHFLGAGGARAVLRADPNTPISELVSRDAIAANPTILGVPGVTAGQIVQWANGTIDVGPREARRLLTSGSANAMPGAAAPANAMLAPQDATAVAAPSMPEFSVFAPPRSLAEAERIKRILDVQSEEAKARAQAGVRRENAPAVAAEAGLTTGAQETARIRAREAEAKRAEAEKLNTAISELERISRPGGLLERSTGSGVGRLLDVAGEFVGMSSRGAQAAAALAPIADVVLKMVPRFEGPQSDKDTAAYQAAAGRLADSTIPNETRLAAAREIIRLMRDRRDQFSYNAEGNATPTAAPAPQRPAATAVPPAPPAPPGMSQNDWGRLWGVMKPEERALWQN